MRKLLVVVVLVVVAWFGWHAWPRHRASAPSDGQRAWVASQKTLPAGLAFVANTNLQEVAPVLRKALPAMTGEFAEIAQGIAAIDKTCGIDPLQAVDSLVVASEKYGYVTVFALAGKTRVDYDRCMNALAKAAGRKAKISDAGGITTYENVYADPYAMRWLGDDVFVAGLGKEGFADAAYLKRMTAGGFAGDQTLTKLGAGIAPDAAFWIVVRDADMGSGGHPGRAVLTRRAANVVFDGRMYPASSDQVKPLADELEQTIALWTLAVQDGELARFKPLVEALHVDEASDHVVVSATVSIVDLVKALAM